MPPKPWERSGIQVEDPVDSPKPWASSREAGPAEVVPESSTSTAGPPSSRPWEVSTWNGNTGGTNAFGGTGYGNYPGYGGG